MSSATSTEELQGLLKDEAFDFRFNCGYTKPTCLVTIEDKAVMIRSLWLHFVHFNPHAELVQLRKGLRDTLQFDALIRLHSEEMWGVLAASSAFHITSQYFCDSFAVCYSENGANNRTREEAIIYFWYEYVSKCAIREDVTLEEVLKFISGSSRLPGTGFDKSPSIHFTDEERLPTVSTCDVSITFPRQMGLLTYEDFKSKMDFYILGSCGFGSV